MNQRFLHNGKPLVVALALSGAVGFAGLGFAQSTSGDQSGASTKTRPAAAVNQGSSSSANTSGATAAGTGSTGQSAGTGSMNTNPSTGSMSTSAKIIAPSKSETSDSAFKKLDASNKGYVTKDDVKSLSGFDSPFNSADNDHDGKLSNDEFKKAWASYTGNAR